MSPLALLDQVISSCIPKGKLLNCLCEVPGSDRLSVLVAFDRVLANSALTGSLSTTSCSYDRMPVISDLTLLKNLLEESLIPCLLS